MPAKFVSKTKISKQGQVSVPLEAREDLGIESGSDVYWYEIGDSLVVVKDLINIKELEEKLKNCGLKPQKSSHSKKIRRK